MLLLLRKATLASSTSQHSRQGSDGRRKEILAAFHC
jgi:hypothetical protein